MVFTLMAAPNRTALLTKVHKVLKKHYNVVLPDEKRTVLEHLLYAVCLENTPYAVADRVFGDLFKTFVDWNDVRVSTTRELAEAMSGLADPTTAADTMRHILQHVFETTYSFDLEALRKENLGVAIKKLEDITGGSPFVVAYAVQAGLGGHMVPVDRGALQALEIVGVITPQDAAQRTVPGMERAISKNKGIEFGSLLHQLGAELIANSFAPSVHKVLLEINAEAKARLPKKGAKKTEAPPLKTTAKSGAKPPVKPETPTTAPPQPPKPAKSSKTPDEPRKSLKSEPGKSEAAKRKPR